MSSSGKDSGSRVGTACIAASSPRRQTLHLKPHERIQVSSVDMNRQVDVLVVGAGPTGSTAAKFAALGGADVLLVEKRSEVGTPLRCGGGGAETWVQGIRVAPGRGVLC